MPKSELKPGSAVRSTRIVSLRLTPLEAEMLDSVVGNGWGDGDFAEWIGERTKVAACKRAMRKLEVAIREQANEKGEPQP